jgi:hypothetical protein
VGQRFEVALAQHDGGPRYDIRSQRTLLCHLTKHTVQVTCNGPGQIDRMAHRHTRSIWPDGQQIHRLGVLVLRSTVFRDCSTSRSPNGWPGFDPRIPLIMSHHARRLMTVVFPATVPGEGKWDGRSGNGSDATKGAGRSSMGPAPHVSMSWLLISDRLGSGLERCRRG